MITTQKTYVIYKDNKIWHVEKSTGNKIEKSEHTSRVKALNSFFSKHPGVIKFYVVLED